MIHSAKERTQNLGCGFCRPFLQIYNCIIMNNLNDKDLIESIRSLISNSLKRWLRTGEACEYLSISASQLQTLKTEGYITVRKLGGTNYYDRHEIDEVMSNLGSEV